MTSRSVTADLYAYAFDSICETCHLTMHGCAALNDPHCLDDVILTGTTPVRALPQNVTGWRQASDLLGYTGSKALFLCDLMAGESGLIEAFIAVSDAPLHVGGHSGGVYNPTEINGGGKGYTPNQKVARIKLSERMFGMQRLLKAFTSQQLSAAFGITPEQVWGHATQRSPEYAERYIELERAVRANELNEGRWTNHAFTRMRRSCGIQRPRTKHSDEVVRRARALRAEGLTIRAIAQLLTDEGHAVGRGTVEFWMRPGERKVA